MRGVKILILFLLAGFYANSQYVQPMGYKDYSFWSQMNIGNESAKATTLSAYLELGKASGSLKGLLLPRGNKDSVVSPVPGLMFYDIPTNTVVHHNGSSWVATGVPDLGFGTIYDNDAITADTTNAIVSKLRLTKALDSIKAVIGSSSFAAGSGLDKVGSTFHLGNTLSQDAIFNGRNYSVSFGQDAARINTFTVYARSGVLIQDTALSGVIPYLTLSGGNAVLSGKKVTISGLDSIVFSGLQNTADTTTYKQMVINPLTGRLMYAPWLGAGGGGGESYTNEEAQDAIGAIVSAEFTYDDGSNSLSINEIDQGKVTGLSAALAAKLENITSLVSAGSGITIAGSGTVGDPFIISRDPDAGSVTVSSATSLTLTNTGSYVKTFVFSGSTATSWTLPAIGTTGQILYVKNRGSAAITLQRAGSNQLYTSSAVTSIIVLPGDAYMLQDDGTYWVVL